VNLHDSLHDRAKDVLAQLRTDGCRFLTSEFVLVEFANTLSSPNFRHRASAFIDGLRESEDVEIIPASSNLFSRGLELYKSRIDKEWSLVDCMSFVLMDEYDITEAFTEDHHFEQAGFQKFL
jgi:predicted nucleic acid-binding protein